MRATGIVPTLHGAPLRDRDGAPVGRIEDLLADTATNRPAWLVVRLDDGRRTVVPARGARSTPQGTQVPHPAATLRGCPTTLRGAMLEPELLRGACRHYGVLAAPSGPLVAVCAPAPPAAPAVAA